MTLRYIETVLLAFLIQFQGCAKPSLEQASKADAPQEPITRRLQDDLIQGVKKRDLSTIVSLVRAGADSNAKDENGETALNIAASVDYADAVILLVSHGANVNQKGYADRSSLFHAKSVGIARILLDAGADVNARDSLGQVPLMHAPFQVSKLLIERGANVNAVDKDGFNPLSVSAEYGEREKIELLLSNGADVNAKAKNGWTALIAAGGRANPAVAELLLQHGANPNAKMDDGFTALMRAALWNSPLTAQVLLKYGADPAVEMNDGRTALAIALENDNRRYGSHARLIELLKKAADVKRK